MTQRELTSLLATHRVLITGTRGPYGIYADPVALYSDDGYPTQRALDAPVVNRLLFSGKLAEVAPGQPFLTRPGQAVPVLAEARGAG